MNTPSTSLPYVLLAFFSSMTIIIGEPLVMKALWSWYFEPTFGIPAPSAFFFFGANLLWWAFMGRSQSSKDFAASKPSAEQFARKAWGRLKDVLTLLVVGFIAKVVWGIL